MPITISMSPRRLRTIAAAALLAVIVPASTTLPNAAALAPGSATAADPVLTWFDVTSRAVAAAGIPVQGPNSAIWATSWLAADRAARTVRDRSNPSMTVAFAQALHDALTALVPAARADVDTALAATLGEFPDDDRTRAAIATGRRAAAAVLGERAGDGLTLADVNVPYTPPTGPGYWVTTTAGRPAVQAGLGDARPYLIEAADQFRLPPPPPLGSPAYRRDLAEVREYGAATGSRRTQPQTDLAMFWAQSSLSAYTQLLRAAVGQLAAARGHRAALAYRVHVVAVFHQATTDAQIAVYAAKFTHHRWRPLTAIREADVAGNPLPDGDPATTPDPDWTPLITTALHPEYPSGHGGYAGAATVVLDHLVGPPAAPVTATSSTAPGQVRTYASWATAIPENIDARVWEGVHFRGAVVAGTHLGVQVARYGLRHG